MRRLLLAILLLLAFGTACSDEEPTSAEQPEEIEQTTLPATVEANSEAEEATEEAVDDPFTEAREELIETGIIAYGIGDSSVIEAIRETPRHFFVPEEYRSQAYANHPLPIGYGQTISQPYIVALMTEAADLEPGDQVLEVGTGSGYQAAVLAELVDHVYTVEIIGALVERAGDTLQASGYDNITVRHADGYFGWPEHAPFDAIVVTAAPDHIPQPLVAQLKVGAHMIIPVGPVGGYQTLWRVTKVNEEEVRTEDLGGVQFVPLTREEQ
jgi:protein-L-isoaspartate(D-aspartate) O-methyltransferase